MNNFDAKRGFADAGGERHDLILRAIEAASQSPSIGLSARMPRQRKAAASQKDGWLTIELNGVSQRYHLEVRTRIRGVAELDAIARRKSPAGEPTLLIVPHLTPTLADECVRHDMQFIDLAGNMYLHPPGQYVFVVGRSPNAEVKRLKSAAGRPAPSASASALRMIFALLCEPSLVHRPYREMAAAAGIALGTVGRVLDDLRERRLLSGADDRHGRRLLDPEALREEWATGYPLRLLPKLNAQRFAAPQSPWWETTDLPAGVAWWGGEVAADRLTRQLRPVTQTLYVKPGDRKDLTFSLARRLRLKADPAGTFEILDAFWDFSGEAARTITAPPLLVYADLMRTREPRNLQTARLIREQME